MRENACNPDTFSIDDVYVLLGEAQTIECAAKEIVGSNGVVELHFDAPNQKHLSTGHTHDQFIAVISGTLNIRVKGDTRTIPVYGIGFIPGGCVHEVEAGSHGCHYLVALRPPVLMWRTGAA